MAKTYTSQEIDVSFDGTRCIHAAVCVSSLPAVFDTDARPWIQPDQAPADDIATVVEHCPSGALQYQRKDGEHSEVPPANNTLVVQANGPIYVHGALDLQGQSQTRLALCRCGASENKPFCDNSHRKIDFNAPGSVPDNTDDVQDPATGGTLTLNPTTDGPVLLKGNYELVGAADDSRYFGNRDALCRCGHSGNKPFCDGTHKKVGFKSG